ncbi:YeiH family protein [Chlorobaculum thiosulfatiphilum]|jgi:uncharacterized integral membrane protein (TIGR00698 family)|uniref:YeiH family protein n=1 Tax=Chlorobaculum thiosulfatiphilum TaxID=115852 RepID=UPI001FED242A|nr:YeiH family protein [Chlorobaculum thiosulfatiphilum]
MGNKKHGREEVIDKSLKHVDTEIPTEEQIHEAEKYGFHSQVQAARVRFDKYFPGVLAAITVAAAATFLSDHYGAPTMLFALLIGMAFRFLSEDEGRALVGIQFASTTVLRIGVALLGMRITLGQIQSLGIKPIAMVFFSVLLTILFGLALSKMMGRGKRFGVLTGGSVGICGASAALAISAILPQHEYSERNTIFTVISVTALSTIAMIAYPVVAHWFGLDHQAAGIFLGGTIHDVAQVVGAGYSVSEQTGDTATVIKLLRVAMLVPAVFILSLIFHTRNQKEGNAPKRFLLPPFIIFFVVFVGINSFGIVPKPATQFVNDASRWCLVTAIGALGMKTSLKSLFEVGWKPVTIMVAETVFLAALVLGSVVWMS